VEFTLLMNVPGLTLNDMQGMEVGKVMRYCVWLDEHIRRQRKEIEEAERKAT